MEEKANSELQGSPSIRADWKQSAINLAHRPNAQGPTQNHNVGGPVQNADIIKRHQGRQSVRLVPPNAHFNRGCIQQHGRKLLRGTRAFLHREYVPRRDSSQGAKPDLELAQKCEKLKRRKKTRLDIVKDMEAITA
jgi:hypothetical protein